MSQSLYFFKTDSLLEYGQRSAHFSIYSYPHLRSLYFMALLIAHLTAAASLFFMAYTSQADVGRLLAHFANDFGGGFLCFCFCDFFKSAVVVVFFYVLENPKHINVGVLDVTGVNSVFHVVTPKVFLFCFLYLLYHTYYDMSTLFLK